MRIKVLIMILIALSGNRELILAFQGGDDTQTGPVKNEKIILCTDRNKYVSGENIWFSIFCTDTESGKLTPLSSVAYTELVNPWNTTVARLRSGLDGGRGSGALQVPDSCSSGTYLLISYTHAMIRNGRENRTINELLIVNPLGSTVFASDAMAIDKVPQAGAVAGEIPERLKFHMDTLFSRRSKVRIRLLPAGESATGSASMSLCASVVPAAFEYFSKGSLPAIPDAGFSTGQSGDSSRFNEQETEHEVHFLRAKILDEKASLRKAPDFLWLSVRGKEAKFYYAKRAQSGIYTFALPPDPVMRNLIIQPEDAAEGMSVDILSPFTGSHLKPDKPHLAIPANLEEIFSEMSFNFQASRIYGLSDRKDSYSPEGETKRRRRFYGIPEMEVKLDDYIKLPSMQEVFFELLPGVNFVPAREGYKISIQNPLTGDFFTGKPLVMIDGVIINDLGVLADLDPERVERIEVVKTPYLIGEIILYGIVNVITRSGDFSDAEMPGYALMLSYNSVEAPPLFISPSYDNTAGRLSRIPDLRNTLYWNPVLKIGEGTETSLEFYTSDIPGKYCIVIGGTDSAGNTVSARSCFTVR